MVDEAASFFAPGPRLAGVRRIAVLRASAVGDYMVALPALHALRRAYPDAHIALMGRRWHVDFLRGRPGPVDEAVEVPPVPGLNLPADAAADGAAAQRFIGHWREQGLDLALQLHGGGRYSNPFLRALRARVSAGMRSPDAEPLDVNLPYHDDHHPAALQLLECVSLVGAGSARLEEPLALRPEDLREADALLPPEGRPLVVLQPGASHPHKRWSPARFAAVGDAFAARGACVAVNGSADEAQLTAAVCGAMRAPALDLAGRLSVGGLAALLARAHLLVSNDTGPAHLARAVGTPTVTVFWVANARSFGPLATRWHRIATSWRMNCPLCGANAMTEGCAHEVSLVDDVPVEMVLALAEDLYERAPERQAADQYAPA
jgi:ADP-heptose:LPS heptosyltransferase